MRANELPNGFFPVMITPFKSNKNIDFDALRQLTDFYLASGCKGLFANCLSSEMFHLTEAERLMVTRTVIDQVDGKVPVIASATFGKELDHNATFTSKLQDIGVHTAVIITNQLVDEHESEKVLLAKLEELYEATNDISFGLYECPVPYKRLISPDLLDIISQSGRFTYLKDTSCDLDQIRSKVIAMQGTKLKLFNANTPTFLASMRLGACGVSPIAGNFFPEFFSYLIANGSDKNVSNDLNQIVTILDEMTGNKFYPMSPKLFLKMRGLDIEPITRVEVPAFEKQDLIKLHAMLDFFIATAKNLGIKLASD